MEGKPQPPYYSGVSSKPSQVRHSARKGFFFYYYYSLEAFAFYSKVNVSHALPCSKSELWAQKHSVWTTILPFFPPLTFTVLCVSFFVHFCPHLWFDATLSPFPPAPPLFLRPPLLCHKFCFNYRQSSSPQIHVYFSPALRSFSLLEVIFFPGETKRDTFTQSGEADKSNHSHSSRPPKHWKLSPPQSSVCLCVCVACLSLSNTAVRAAACKQGHRDKHTLAYSTFSLPSSSFIHKAPFLDF